MADDEARMTFTEHLAELRTRLIRSAIAIVVCIIVSYLFSEWILVQITRPLVPLHKAGIFTPAPEDVETPPEGEGPPAPVEGEGPTAQSEGEAPAAPEEVAQVKPQDEFSLQILNPLELILVELKLAAFAGIVLAFPYVLYQAAAFIFPGLKPGERRLVRILFIGCSVFAILGVSVAYFAVFPLVLPYLAGMVPPGVEINFRLSETVSIILKGLAAFAIAFQFPMVVMILTWLDLVTPAVLRKYRRLSYVGIAIASAVLTPPDPGSMILMMVPLVVLYEMSIWLSYLVIRRKKKAAAQEEAPAEGPQESKGPKKDYDLDNAKKP